MRPTLLRALPTLLLALLVAAPDAWALQRGQRGTPPRPQGRKGRQSEKTEPKELPPNEHEDYLVPQLEGELGTVAPQPPDVVAEDAPVHQDTHGRAQHQLQALAGRDGAGFAAVWRDTRDGNMGLYFARIGLDGRLREAERPVYARGSSSREVEPCVAVGEGCSGGLAWFSSGVGDDRVNLRFFDPEGAFVGSDRPLMEPGGAGQAAGRRQGLAGPRASGTRRVPQIALWPDGSGSVVWAADGRLWHQALDTSGQPAGRPEAINPRGPLALSPPRLAGAPRAGLICAWSCSEGIATWRRRRSGGAVLLPGGPGELLGTASAAPSGAEGWWLLVDLKGRVVLRHLPDLGRPDRRDVEVLAAPVEGGDLAVWSSGVAVLLEERRDEGDPRTRAGPFRLELFDPGGRPLRREVAELLADESRGAFGPRIAAAGDLLMAAWTERRAGSLDVYSRLVAPGSRGRMSPVRRVNTDARSSDQRQQAVAGDGLSRAAVAWSDDREGTWRVYVRLMDREGAFTSPEIPVPAPLEPREGEPAVEPAALVPGEIGGRIRPVVAMGEQGRFLVAWKERVAEDRWAVRAQAFDAQGAPASADLDLDVPAESTPAQSSPAATALRGGRGYAVAWTRTGGGLRARHVSASGSLGATTPRLSSADSPANPSLALLDDSRVLVAWDATTPVKLRQVYAHFLTQDLRPDGGELDFELMFRGSDWNPRVAPGPDGGFGMAWITGEGHGRDIFVRFFDREGTAVCRPIPATVKSNEQDAHDLIRAADRSWILAWEDDISGYDHAYVRRFDSHTLRPGPTVTLNQRAAAFNENRGGPRVAAFDTGFVGVWTDCRRSQGSDVFRRVLGPGFDEVEEPVGELDEGSEAGDGGGERGGHRR